MPQLTDRFKGSRPGGFKHTWRGRDAQIINFPKALKSEREYGSSAVNSLSMPL